MPLSGVFVEKEKDALAKRVLDFYEDIRYKYLSAREDPKEYQNQWKKSIEKVRSDFDGLNEFSTELKRYIDEDVIFDDEVLNPTSHRATKLWEQIQDMRFNSEELNDPFAKQLGDKVIETLLESPSIYAMFIHYALRTHAHSIEPSSWEKHDLSPDEITEGATGLDLQMKDIPLYISEHYGDDKDTRRIKSKFAGALATLKKVYLVKESEENWKKLVAIDLKKSDEEKAEVDFIVPNKPMYRIFELDDIKELKGFSGEWLVQEKYDGIRIQIHKIDGKVKIYTYNQKDITDKCKKIADKLKEKKFGDVILDAELILYDDDEPLHRADTIAHLFKNKYKEASLKARVFDIMHHDGDNIDDSPLRERINILFYQYAQHSTDYFAFPSKKNTRIADSLKEIGKYSKSIMESRTSEGVVIKDLESTYYIGTRKNPKWIKWKKFVDLDVIVLEKKKTKSNLYSYTVGIGPLTLEEDRELNGVEIDNRKYLNVGKALNTKTNVEVGSIIRVKVDEVKKKGKGFSLFSAKVIEVPEVELPDKLLTIQMLSKDSRKSLNYDVQEALLKYTITDGVHGESDIILKTDFEGFTVFGFEQDNLMSKNALANMDAWKDEITSILKTKSSDARVTIKNYLQEQKQPMDIRDIFEFAKETIPKISDALWNNEITKFKGWINEQDAFVKVGTNNYEANEDKLIKDEEEPKSKTGTFKIYSRKDDNLDLLIEINDERLNWIIDIGDTEDIYNLFGKAGKFPAEVGNRIRPDKLLDKGKITLGVQKHGYHEYKIEGNKFETRLHFRVVPVKEQDKWIVWTGYKQEMLDSKEDEGIWDIREDRFKKLTMQIS